MKKVLALALALIMMFAVCVPAFAGTLEGNKDNNFSAEASDAVVKTKFADGKTEEDYQYFTVTYDAETVFEWNETGAKDIHYSVDTQLISGKKVQVTVAKKDGAEMMNGTTPLAYNLTGTGVDSAAEVLASNKNAAFTCQAEVADWYAAPIGEYVGYLTYTAMIVAA